ncbi:MAG: helix-hairpin-helix domain-containing protein [Planctomycetota bacterium]
MMVILPDGRSPKPKSPSPQTDAAVPACDDALEHRSLADNQRIAGMLIEVAGLLKDQEANAFRVQAYQNAAQKLQQMNRSVRDIHQRDGMEGLIAIPTIGVSISQVIDQYLRFGHIPLLDRLRGEAIAERAFATLPTIGSQLAHRLYDHLHVDSLSELDSAAHDGRLAAVPGIGPKRLRAIQASLDQRFRSHQQADARPDSAPAAAIEDVRQSTPIDEILEVDAEYLRKARSGELPRIAPRKFNPNNEAWLPILHTDRQQRHYTALFSNTARAHQLNTTRDWVVIYRDDVDDHGRWTVITSQYGRLKGCRIVRGRESECLGYYRRLQHSKGAQR